MITTKLHFTSHIDHCILLRKCHQHTRFYHYFLWVASFSTRMSPQLVSSQPNRSIFTWSWLDTSHKSRKILILPRDQKFGAQDFDFGILIPFPLSMAGFLLKDQFVSSPFFWAIFNAKPTGAGILCTIVRGSGIRHTVFLNPMGKRLYKRK